MPDRAGLTWAWASVLLYLLHSKPRLRVSALSVRGGKEQKTVVFVVVTYWSRLQEMHEPLLRFIAAAETGRGFFLAFLLQLFFAFSSSLCSISGSGK